MQIYCISSGCLRTFAELNNQTISNALRFGGGYQ